MKINPDVVLYLAMLASFILGIGFGWQGGFTAGKKEGFVRGKVAGRNASI